MASPEEPSVNVEMERVMRGVAQRAAAALVDSWIDAAQNAAAVAALMDERNTAARAAEAEQARQANS